MNAVGMAIAERYMASLYNTDAHTIVDHFTYALVGDGDLMEGIALKLPLLPGTLNSVSSFIFMTRTIFL